MTAVPQHLQALARADAHRLGTASFRDELRALGRERGGEAARRVADALQTRDDDVFGSARVRLLLTAVPGLGEASARKFLTAAAVKNAEFRVRDLSMRQRVVIAERLEDWAGTRR